MQIAVLPTPPYRLRAVTLRDSVITVGSLVFLLLWEFAGWDRTVAHWFGDAGGFKYQNAWWSQRLLHDGGRWLATAALVLVLVDLVRPFVAGPSRRERLLWVMVTVACMLIAPAIKQYSTTSCPWDLAEFGGRATYVPHWLLRVADGGPGHCFPSGHAVSAFGFLSLYFLWRAHRPLMAKQLLFGICVLGALLGFGQLARGAHFVSHTLWSAWLCWTLCAVVSWLVAARAPQRGLPAEPA